jgi:hypothetical protein
MEENEKMMDNKGKGLLHPSQSVRPIPDEESTWRPPPVGSLLASADAGWDALSKKAGLGAVVRDEKGGVVKCPTVIYSTTRVRKKLKPGHA